MTRLVDFRYTAVRNGADFCLLRTAANSGARLEMNAADRIKTSLRVNFLPPEEEVNWLTDEIRPEIVIDGVPHSLGLYSACNVGETESAEEKILEVTAYDRCWILSDVCAERLIFFAAGTNYLEAVSSLITEAGITLISMVQSSAVLTEDREDWELGTSYLDIVNELLSEINYKQVWFDSSGTAILEPDDPPTDANMKHVLDDTTIESLILPGINRETDYHSAPNVFLCICSNADKGASMRAVAENTNPQSPLSIGRRGRRIVQVLYVNNIESQDALQLYADRQVTDSLLQGEELTVNTFLLPGFGVSDVVGLRYGELFTLCRETRWSMELSAGGSMRHTLERVVMNLE